MKRLATFQLPESKRTKFSNNNVTQPSFDPNAENVPPVPEPTPQEPVQNSNFMIIDDEKFSYENVTFIFSKKDSSDTKIQKNKKFPCKEHAVAELVTCEQTPKAVTQEVLTIFPLSALVLLMGQ